MYNEESFEEEKKIEKINPWLHIWTKPRATVRSAITHNSIGLAFVLAMIVGIANTWDNAVSQNAGEKYLMDFSLLGLIIGIIIIGCLFGLLSWLLTASLLTLVGKWLGGKGSVRDLLIATGISFIPIALLLSFNVIDLLVLGESLFIDTHISEGHYNWLWISTAIVLVVSIWNIFISLQSIGEAHRFSAWRALAVVILVGIMAFFVLALLLVLVMGIF